MRKEPRHSRRGPPILARVKLPRPRGSRPSLPLRRRLPLRHLRARLARLRQPDRDRLLAALHRATFATLAALQRPLVPLLHHPLDALARRLSVLARTLFPRCHEWSSPES